MNAYKVYYHPLPTLPKQPVSTEVFCCWADNKEHAIEQARNAEGAIAIERVDKMECEQGGDLADRCKDCAYNIDYEFDIPSESCIKKGSQHE